MDVWARLRYHPLGGTKNYFEILGTFFALSWRLLVGVVDSSSVLDLGRGSRPLLLDMYLRPNLLLLLLLLGR